MELAFFVIPVIIFSIILHEIAHGWSALFLGDKTALNAGRLTLNPFPHLDPIGSVLLPILTFATGFIFGYAKPVPYNPNNLRKVNALGKEWSEAIVAFSGPAMNIILAILFAGIYHVLSGPAISVMPVVLNGLAMAVVLNIFLAFLNLIPVPPLDGSKILFTFLPYKARRFMEKYQLLLIGIALVAIIFTPVLEVPTIFFASRGREAASLCIFISLLSLACLAYA